MITIRNLHEMRQLPDSPIKTCMEAEVAVLSEADDELVSLMEDSFDDALGGDWYVFEQHDDPRQFPLEDIPTDLLSQEWNWCDIAELTGGSYRIFWATNNAGGPCLFVPDEPWIPSELKERLNDLIDYYESDIK